MNVVSLSTGHVFAKDSVTCISPIQTKFGYSSYTVYDKFQVIGIGFAVDITLSPREYLKTSTPVSDPQSEIIRQEFIDKLLA